MFKKILISALTALTVATTGFVTLTTPSAAQAISVQTCYGPDVTRASGEAQGFTYIRTLSVDELKVLASNVSIEYGESVDYVANNITIELYNFPESEGTTDIIVVMYVNGCYDHMSQDTLEHIGKLLEESDPVKGQ